MRSPLSTKYLREEIEFADSQGKSYPKAVVKKGREEKKL